MEASSEALNVDVEESSDESIAFADAIMSHLLKANRNQLRASSEDGAKDFVDEHGCSFGWSFFREVYQEDQRAATNEDVPPSTRITDRTVDPENCEKMSMELAKIPFEDKTLGFALKAVVPAHGNPPPRSTQCYSFQRPLFICNRCK